MRKLSIILLFSFIINACHPGQKGQDRSLNQLPETILGIFNDDYGSTYRISRKEWVQDSSIKYHLLRYDPTGNYLIARNDRNNPSDPGLYTRIDITYFEKMEPWRWGFCLTVYKAATMEEAIHTAAADRTNPRKGCGGFPFTRMKQ